MTRYVSLPGGLSVTATDENYWLEPGQVCYSIETGGRVLVQDEVVESWEAFNRRVQVTKNLDPTMYGVNEKMVDESNCTSQNSQRKGVRPVGAD